MGESALDQLLVPWWKLVIYLSLVVLGLFSLKVRIIFNLNDWLQKREDAKTLKEWQKRASNCHHTWVLYTDSVYSQCSSCEVYILTSTLMVGRQLAGSRPIIRAEHRLVRITPKQGEPVVPYWETRNYKEENRLKQWFRMS